MRVETGSVLADYGERDMLIAQPVHELSYAFLFSSAVRIVSGEISAIAAA
jgi:hypothetical protein